MVAVRPADVDNFIARPDPGRSVVLVFGPDAGLVSERARALVTGSVDDINDPFSLVRLEADDLGANPARLIEEAQTIPLFGGRRAVWLKAGTRNIAPAVGELLALPASECRVVIEAGELRRNSPLRALCERARNAAALPCYGDGERELTKLIDAEMRNAGLTLTPDARAVLTALLGGDRAASRGEIRKLVLYAQGLPRVEVEDVLAAVADASSLELDELVDTAFAGRPSELEAQFGKARAAGSAVGSLFFAAQRQVALLHKWRVAIESGAPFSLDAVQPPLHFRRKALVEAALKQWTADRLARAMSDLADATLASRRRPALAAVIAERALLTLALAARRKAMSDSRG